MHSSSSQVPRQLPAGLLAGSAADTTRHATLWRCRLSHHRLRMQPMAALPQPPGLTRYSCRLPPPVCCWGPKKVAGASRAIRLLQSRRSSVASILAVGLHRVKGRRCNRLGLGKGGCWPGRSGPPDAETTAVMGPPRPPRMGAGAALQPGQQLRCLLAQGRQYRDGPRTCTAPPPPTAPPGTPGVPAPLRAEGRRRQAGASEVEQLGKASPSSVPCPCHVAGWQRRTSTPRSTSRARGAAAGCSGRRRLCVIQQGLCWHVRMGARSAATAPRNDAAVLPRPPWFHQNSASTPHSWPQYRLSRRTWYTASGGRARHAGQQPQR